MHRSAGRFRGFTLVEVLVVVAVIAVLAGLLLGALHGARETARAGTCRSNQRQLGTAIKLYTQDYDERLPLRVLELPAPTWPHTWDLQVQPHLKNAQVLKCPSDTQSHRIDVPGLGPGMFRSYSMAENMAGKALAEVPAGSSAVLLVETHSILQRPGDVWSWALFATIHRLGKTRLKPEYPVISELPDFRHHDSANYLFLDNHMKTYRGPNPRFPGYRRDSEGVSVCGANDPLPQQ